MPVLTGGAESHSGELESKPCRGRRRQEGLRREEGEQRTQRDALGLVDDDVSGWKDGDAQEERGSQSSQLVL